jgi:hypothetical protein
LADLTETTVFSAYIGKDSNTHIFSFPFYDFFLEINVFFIIIITSMSLLSPALESNRLKTTPTARYGRLTATPMNSSTFQPPMESPPATLADDFDQYSLPPSTLPAADEEISTPVAENLPATPVTASPTLATPTPFAAPSMPAVPIIDAPSTLPTPADAAKTAPIAELREVFEQSLNQTLDHLKTYLHAAVEAQIQTSVKSAELPAPQEFLAQVRDIVQAAVNTPPTSSFNPSIPGGLKPLPKLSFLNRPYGKWSDSATVPVTEKITAPSPAAARPIFQETAKVEAQPIMPKAAPVITNPPPAPTDKLPWEAQNPFL